MSSFESIYTHLATHSSTLLPPSKPHDTTLTSKISALQLHPTLESTLHILNLDLGSAHFLVRHMQSAPTYEGMYLHGILHRIEGDYDNARAWYSDVRDSEIYTEIWGTEGVDWKTWKEKGGERDAGQVLLDNVQALMEGREGNKEELEKISIREFESVIEYCKNKFGTDRWEDASSAWVKHNPQIRQMGEDQISGNQGRRKF